MLTNDNSNIKREICDRRKAFVGKNIEQWKWRRFSSLRTSAKPIKLTMNNEIHIDESSEDLTNVDEEKKVNVTVTEGLSGFLNKSDRHQEHLKLKNSSRKSESKKIIHNLLDDNVAKQQDNDINRLYQVDYTKESLVNTLTKEIAHESIDIPPLLSLNSCVKNVQNLTELSSSAAISITQEKHEEHERKFSVTSYSSSCDQFSDSGISTFRSVDEDIIENSIEDDTVLKNFQIDPDDGDPVGSFYDDNANIDMETTWIETYDTGFQKSSSKQDINHNTCDNVDFNLFEELKKEKGK